MDRSKLVINTLVFLQNLKSGIPQSKIIDTIHKLNINNVEVRREFIKDFNKELSDIKEKSQRYDMNIFYSVPEWIYKDGKVRAKQINDYFKEAYLMKCHNIKMNIGEVREVQKDDVDHLNELCKKYDIKLTVENDQTYENGRCDKIYKFLNDVKSLNGNINFTFDIGNWVFQGEDPCKNAELIKSFVTYIHLKDIGKENSTVLLNEGFVDWKSILKILPHNIPIGLEYPCTSKEQILLEINKVINC